MKITWGTSDVKAGRYVTFINNEQPHQTIGYIATTVAQIGYIAGSDKDGDERWFLVAITDGYIFAKSTKEGLRDVLTRDAYLPVTNRILKKCFEALRDRHIDGD